LRASISSRFLLVLLGMQLGMLHHLLDVGLGQAARRLDADLLLLLVACPWPRPASMPLASMSNVPRPAACRAAPADSDQVELAQQLVWRRSHARLEHADGHRGLVVVGRREGLALLGR